MTLSLRVLGAIAAVFYALHAGWHIAHGHAWDLLWACNASMPLLVLGCFLEKPRLVAINFLVLVYGTPIWILDLMTGAGMVLTSPLVHFGGPVIGILALRNMGQGWPKNSWLYASAFTLLLLLSCRICTPASENVNLAFRIHGGWEKYFSSVDSPLWQHILYVALMWSSATFVFFIVERIAARAIRARV